MWQVNTSKYYCCAKTGAGRVICNGKIVKEAVLLADRVIVMSANLGVIKKEFHIQLVRPRQPENIDVAYLVSDIMRELKGRVGQLVNDELETEWINEKNNILSNSNRNMGIGI